MESKKIIELPYSVYRLIVAMLWTILIVAILKNYESPQWDGIMIGDRFERSLNDIIFYLGIDIILLLWAIIAFVSFNNIISWMLLMLGIGKVFDEFLAPYGYHPAEQFYDILIFTWAICKFINRKRKLKLHKHG